MKTQAGGEAREILELIGSIEAIKIRLFRRDLRARDLHRGRRDEKPGA